MGLFNETGGRQVSVAELEQTQHHSLNALYKTAKAQLQIANAVRPFAFG
jgi:hypothetical protein